MCSCVIWDVVKNNNNKNGALKTHTPHVTIQWLIKIHFTKVLPIHVIAYNEQIVT